MDVALFLIVVAASFIIVRIGAVAFQLTGLRWSLAKFQSLSCFSGTGFTTREAELITGDHNRRRIASILMVLGNAGLVTMIATVASALNPEHTLLSWISTSFVPWVPLWLEKWVNLAIIVLGLVIAYRIFTNQKLIRKLTHYARHKIVKLNLLGLVDFEELAMIADGVGITKVNIDRGNSLIGKSLDEIGLKEKEIRVLAVVRDGAMTFQPGGDFQIQRGDELYCLGPLNVIRKVCVR